MSVQQIPVILKSISPQFNEHTAIKITGSQYTMMKEVIKEYGSNNDASRLYGILGRIGRRMKQVNNPHLWSTEFDFFATSMMHALKERRYCREEDSIDDIDEIFARHNIASMPGKNRDTDKNRVMSIFK